MEGLFLGQFEQLLANDLVLIGFIDPEIPASAGVFHDRAPILAGDCDFHLDFSWQVFRPAVKLATMRRRRSGKMNL